MMGEEGNCVRQYDRMRRGNRLSRVSSQTKSSRQCNNEIISVCVCVVTADHYPLTSMCYCEWSQKSIVTNIVAVAASPFTANRLTSNCITNE
mmetsp:Transcript_20480/g.22857  ORF Transcript_20480/g.22857 Transcript_20480/m.22857 type:complete len:92 (+) Transcript_20480:100-375(+)